MAGSCRSQLCSALSSPAIGKRSYARTSAPFPPKAKHHVETSRECPKGSSQERHEAEAGCRREACPVVALSEAAAVVAVRVACAFSDRLGHALASELRKAAS